MKGKEGRFEWGKMMNICLQQTIIYMKIQRKVTQKGY